MNIMMCLSTAFENWLRQLDRAGWLRYATPPANLWKGSRTDLRLVEILVALQKLMGFSNLYDKISPWLTLNRGRKKRKRKNIKTEEGGEWHWLYAIVLSSSKSIALKVPPTRVCVLEVTPIRLPRFTQSSSRNLVPAFLPSFIPSAYLKNAEAHNDRDNSPVTSTARSVAINVSLCVLKVQWLNNVSGNTI